MLNVRKRQDVKCFSPTRKFNTTQFSLPSIGNVAQTILSRISAPYHWALTCKTEGKGYKKGVYGPSVQTCLTCLRFRKLSFSRRKDCKIYMQEYLVHCYCFYGKGLPCLVMELEPRNKTTQENIKTTVLKLIRLLLLQHVDGHHRPHRYKLNEWWIKLDFGEKWHLYLNLKSYLKLSMFH